MTALLRSERQAAAPLAPKQAPPCLAELTFFPNRVARTVTRWAGSPDDLEARFIATVAASKGGLPLISGCRFGSHRSDKGCLRTDENVVAVVAVVAEHDAGRVTLAEAKARLAEAGIAAFIFETPSNTPDAPRWRVIVFLSAEHPPAAYKGLVDKLAVVLGEGVLAPESWVRSQAFYFGYVTGGPCNFAVVEGAPLDLLHVAGRDPRHEGGEASVPADDDDADDWAADVAQRPETPPPTMAQLRDALSFFPPDCTRAEWVRIAAGLRGHEAETGDPTEGLFVDWSAGRLRRDGAKAPANFVSDNDCLRLFRSLRRDRIEA